jgi:uncharacterized protein YciI
MHSYKEWIKSVIDDGDFLVSGSLKPTNTAEKSGCGIIAHYTSLEKVQKCVNKDLFVIHNVVTEQVLGILPNQVDERLSFLFFYIVL